MLPSVDARWGETRLGDPHFEDFLADPMVRLLMRQDHVQVDDARRLYADAADRIRQRRNRRAVLTASLRAEPAAAL